MAVFQMLSGIVETLREASKIFFRSGILIPCIALLSIFLNSILLFSNIFFIKLFVTHFFFEVELVFLVAIAFPSLFIAEAIIVVSAANRNRMELHVKEVFSNNVGQSLKRASFIFFYTTLLDLGYTIFVLALILFPFDPIFINPNSSTIYIFFILVFILAIVFNMYLALVWTIAFVVSVLEEKCGLEALGEALDLVKGSKWKGLLLNLLFGGLSFSLLQFWRINMSQKSRLEEMFKENTAPLFILISGSCLIRVFSLISFTVFYFECKERHGKNVEMQDFIAGYVPADTRTFSSDIA